MGSRLGLEGRFVEDLGGLGAVEVDDLAVLFSVDLWTGHLVEVHEDVGSDYLVLTCLGFLLNLDVLVANLVEQWQKVVLLIIVPRKAVVFLDVGNRDMVFFGLSFDLDCALLAENVQAALQRVFFLVFSLDFHFLDDVFGVPEGALVVIMLMALLVVLIPTFLPCPAFQVDVGVCLRHFFEAVKRVRGQSLEAASGLRPLRFHLKLTNGSKKLSLNGIRPFQPEIGGYLLRTLAFLPRKVDAALFLLSKNHSSICIMLMAKTRIKVIVSFFLHYCASFCIFWLKDFILFGQADLTAELCEIAA